MEKLGKSMMSIAAVFFVPAILKLIYGLYTVITFAPRREWNGYTGWDAAAESFSVCGELLTLAVAFMVFGGLLMLWHDRRQLNPATVNDGTISNNISTSAHRESAQGDYLDIPELAYEGGGKDSNSLKVVSGSSHTNNYAESDSYRNRANRQQIKKKQQKTEKVA